MSSPTTPKKQAEPKMDHNLWSAGNGPLQVPLSGLLASDPSLRDAELTPSQWQARLDKYLATPTSR